MSKEVQAPIDRLSQRLQLQWPIRVMTQEQFDESKKKQAEVAKEHVFIVDPEDVEVTDAEVAVVMGKAYLAEKYDPLFAQVKLVDSWQYHEHLGEMEGIAGITQQASNIWALDVIHDQISPDLVPLVIQKQLPSLPLPQSVNLFLQRYPHHLVAGSANLEASLRRFGLTDGLSTMRSIVSRMELFIPDFVPIYQELVDNYQHLPKPRGTRDEMLESFEESSRFTAKVLDFDFMPTLVQEIDGVKWALSDPNYFYQ